ncbi:NUDIX hydrolase [Alsobacter sp. KACC 23698]|uniref:NUDIX hydrolase n=1 Tax=Alsobacter sp. KACC 23698 TaxID=3149229 RepID=A0AAU7JBA8_9HYPH
MNAPTGDLCAAPVIARVAAVECRLVQRPWAWAEGERERIDAHWAELASRNPALFDGRVLVLHSGGVEGDVFRASYLETGFSRFIAWRDFGFPDRTIRNAFAMAALRSSDGAYLLGVMGPHTANSGKVYFPAGTPDLSDVVGDAVDLSGSVARELEEETGLTAADVAFADDWSVVTHGQRIALMRLVQAREAAEPLRQRILAELSRQKDPELSDIRIVRGTGDLDEAAMPPFVCAYLRQALGEA